MAKKNYQSVQSLIQDIKKDIQPKAKQGYIPDIITFCESRKYLGLPFLSNPIALYPAQRIILKAFYRHSVGNENIVLTDDELKLCKEWGLNSEDNGDLIGKYFGNEIFRELVLVWGRRGGKDFISAIIALYEAMKLIECEGGDPYAIYGISAANPFTILTVATAKEQAQIAFMEMKEKLMHSKYFEDKIGKDGIETSKIWLLTPKDKRDNNEFAKKGLPIKRGSIVLEVGHSNSDSLLGKGVFVLILDEVAAYKMTGSSASGERIYTAMTPSLNTYVRMIPILDENRKVILSEDGTSKIRAIYDSKIISISSPRGKEGIFYDLFSKANQVKDRLACRLPTWKVVPNQKEESLRIANLSMTEEKFLMEFGADFSGTAGENFFPKQSVELCFVKNIKLREIGEPGKVYFAHLDPARTSHNYAMVLLHKDTFLDPAKGKSDYCIIVDMIKFWHPLPGKPVNIDEVNDFVVNLKRRFHLGMVTYDIWNSDESISLLKKNGIPAKCTPYVKRYQMTIFDELYNLVLGGKLKIPFHQLLYDEMINLQRKYTNNGYKVYARSEGDVVTDDVVDCLAGACYNTLSSMGSRLPPGRLVNTGIVPSSNDVMWRSMQGVPLGYGAGEVVARRLEERRPWPMPLSGGKRFR